MNEYSDELKRVFASAPTDEVVLETIELFHSALAEPIRLVCNLEDLDLTLEDDTTHTFEGVGFRLALPPAGDNGLQDLSLEIDNVDPEQRITDFVNTIKGSKEPVQVKYRPYVASDLTQPQTTIPLILWLRGLSINTFSAAGKASFADIINRRFPSELYTRDRFPSLGE